VVGVSSASATRNTTIVGAEALGYADERPRYKHAPKRITASAYRPMRARVCDELIRRVGGLRDADPPLDLRSHEGTRQLVEEPSPLGPETL